MKKTALLLAFAASCLFAHGQMTQITASHIAAFGGAPITGTFCVTPTDSHGTPINLTTSVGQQFYPRQPLCFSITAGVLSNLAVVPDVSLSQPQNACMKLTVSDNTGLQIGSYACLQPTGTTWNFDTFVPSSLPSIPALTLPIFQTNGVPNASQRFLNIICSGCTNSGGNITIPAGGSGSLPNVATNTLFGNNSGSLATPFALTASQAAAILSGLFDAPGAATAAQTAAIAASLPRQIYTVGTGGVTQNLIIAFDATGKAIAATASGFPGIAAATVASGGTVEVVRSGIGTCVFDGASTIGDIVVASISTFGQCHDSGLTSSLLVPKTQQVVGVVQTASAGAGQTGTIRLHPVGAFGGLIGAGDLAAGTYVAGAGSVNVLTATLNPAPTALAPGLEVDVLPNLANTTTTPTLNVNALGAATITKNGTAALAAGDLTTTAIAKFLYDGTRWQLLNPQTSTGSAGALLAANNLSDLGTPATARTNLGLGTAATQASGAFDAAGAATTAQAASLQKTSNLSDLASAATARTNLGLGTAATQASGAFDASGAAAAAQAASDASGAAATAQAASLQKSSNLSDLANAGTARTNLGLGTAAQSATSAFDASGAATAAQAAAIAASAQRANNLSDLASATTARTNLGLGTAAVAVAPANTAAVSHQFVTSYNSATGAYGQAAIGPADTAGGSYVAAAGSVNVLTATLAPVPAALVTGMEINILPNLANTTTTPTLNVNALGAKTITKLGTNALAAGDLTTTAVADLIYDGTNWQLQNPQISPAAGALVAANNLSDLASATTARTNLGLGTAAVAVAPANTAAVAHKLLTAYNSSTGAFTQSNIAADDTSAGAYVAGAGLVNVMTATLSPAPASLSAGLEVNVLPNLTNTTTTPTLNVNGLGAATITKNGTFALVAGDYTTTAVAKLIYDGTRWQLLNPQTLTAPQLTNLTTSSGTYTTPTGASWLEVTITGAGGGGGSSGTGATAGAAGTASTFGSLTANAGGGGAVATGYNALGGAGGAGGCSGASDFSGTPGGIENTGTYTTGSSGGVAIYGGAVTAAGYSANGTNLNAVANSGAGGGGAGSQGNASPGLGGGGAETCYAIISSPSATYSYTVGAGGTGSTAGNYPAGNGAAGRIIVVAH